MKLPSFCLMLILFLIKEFILEIQINQEIQFWIQKMKFSVEFKAASEVDYMLTRELWNRVISHYTKIMIPTDFCIFNIKIPNKKLHFSSSVVISAKFEAFQFHIFRLFFKMKNLKLDLLYGSPPNFATNIKQI